MGFKMHGLMIVFYEKCVIVLIDPVQYTHIVKLFPQM